MKKKVSAFLGAVLLAVSLSGCGMFGSEFSTYDVSGYIKALLESNYYGESENLMTKTGQTKAEADENLQATVENGAIYFCNAFEINPSDAQMQQVEEIVRKAYGQAKYTVRGEQETNTGYAVDVEIEPLTVFADCLPEAASLKADTEKLAEKQQNTQGLSDVNGNAGEDEFTDEDGDGYPDDNPDSFTDEDGDGYPDEDSEPFSENPDSRNGSGTTVNVTDVYIDEVISLCQQKINSTPAYGTKTTVTLKILRTAEGELQLDTTQLEDIDQTVVLFAQQKNS